jgi:hypothetical protein
MRSYDKAMTVFIVVIFIFARSGARLLSSIEEVKANWKDYKCKPNVMPLAGVFGHEPIQNFQDCVKSIQADNMGQFLSPLTYKLDSLAESGNNLNESIARTQSAGAALSGIFGSGTIGIAGSFDNVRLEFTQFAINLKDTFAKLGGTANTIMKSAEASTILMKSLWKGGPGDAVRFMCFDPTTPIDTRRGTIPIDQIIIGDEILGRGTRFVTEVHHFNNIFEGQQIESMYRVPGDAEVIVSGSHLVYVPADDQFVRVDQLSAATRHTEPVERLICLSTTDQLIPIAGVLFHDYDDLQE